LLLRGQRRQVELPDEEVHGRQEATELQAVAAHIPEHIALDLDAPRVPVHGDEVLKPAGDRAVIPPAEEVLEQACEWQSAP
jgi:hypothetical protein